MEVEPRTTRQGRLDVISRQLDLRLGLVSRKCRPQPLEIRVSHLEQRSRLVVRSLRAVADASTD
jgi:hypothetical protein